MKKKIFIEFKIYNKNNEYYCDVGNNTTFLMFSFS